MDNSAAAALIFTLKFLLDESDTASTRDWKEEQKVHYDFTNFSLSKSKIQFVTRFIK